MERLNNLPKVGLDPRTHILDHCFLSSPIEGEQRPPLTPFGLNVLSGPHLPNP